MGWMTWTIWVTWVTFGGSSGSHLQTKLSGCDSDITYSLKNIVGIWLVSDLLGLMNGLKYIIGVKPCSLLSQDGLKHMHVVFEDFIFKKSARDQFCILPRMKKSMALFHIKNFSYHATKLQHASYKCFICGSHPDCSVGQVGQQV